THVFDENGQVQLAAAGDTQNVRLLGVFHAQRDVALQLPIEPLAQLPAGHELAFAAGKGRGVDLEVHRQCRLVDADGRETFRHLLIADREPDVYCLDAVVRGKFSVAWFSQTAVFRSRETQHLTD